MPIPTYEQIIENRKLLQNPYAHINEIDGWNVLACTAKTEVKSIEISRLTENPNASLSATQSTTILSRKTKIYDHQLVPNLRAMQNPYAFIPDNVHAISKYALLGNPYARIGETDTSAEISTNTNQSTSHIEQIARNIQTKIWKRRTKLWPDGVPTNPVDLLEPSVAFNSIGYDFYICESLDDYSNGENFKIAGLIYQKSKKTYISNQFSPEIQRFTSAHELGHALMHQNSGLHRDRGLDGSPIKGKKDRVEIEADKFAAFFLMPKNLVVSRFEQLFGRQVFILNDATIFAVDPGNKMNLIANKKNLRYISRVLAEATHYNNKHFVSLSKQFRVSVEAMAIRLEELKLIKI